MLCNLDRQAQHRAAEEARRDGIEDLAAHVSIWLGRVAEAEAGGHELDLRARPGERRGQLVVVRRREGRRIGEEDAHGSVRYAVAMLVRTWNLFHGNAVPPGRRAYLREMIELVTRDRPDVVCLQELPVWALPHLEAWSGMHASGAVASAPVALAVGLGRVVTALHHGLLRSAVTGEADAILTREPARALGVHVVGETKRRVFQAHAESRTSRSSQLPRDRRRIADEQFDRVVASSTRPSGPVILCGDANSRPGQGRRTTSCGWGFSEPAPGIDQILVRGLPSTPPLAWPEERRRVGGRLLSDHAPVELQVG